MTVHQKAVRNVLAIFGAVMFILVCVFAFRQPSSQRDYLIAELIAKIEVNAPDLKSKKNDRFVWSIDDETQVSGVIEILRAANPVNSEVHSMSISQDILLMISFRGNSDELERSNVEISDSGQIMMSVHDSKSRVYFDYLRLSPNDLAKLKTLLGVDESPNSD